MSMSALALTRLKNWIDSLPSGFYVVNDNAYICIRTCSDTIFRNSAICSTEE